MQHRQSYRFSIAAGGHDSRWHAVDLGRASAVSGEVVSVCGARCQLSAAAGAFIHGDSRLQSPRRCERCGWVVALSMGATEAEIDYYTADFTGTDAGEDARSMLRRIFTAILADAPPGRDGESGYRSDLLAHAACHRPVRESSAAVMCAQCQVPAPCSALRTLARHYEGTC